MASDARFTDSGIEIKPVYGGSDLEGWDEAASASPPGPAVAIILTPRGAGRGVRFVRMALGRPAVAGESGG